MKRFSVEEGPAPKRPRLAQSGDDNLFDETRRKTAEDLLDPATDETGNVEAKVHMIFPRMGVKLQLNLEMHEHGNTYRFLVLIASEVDKLHPFPFNVGDIICLSLKGAQIRARAQSSAPCYLPVALTFKDGIAIKLMSGPEAGKVFNTWEVDWFNATVNIPRVADVVRQDSTEYANMPKANCPSESSQPETVAGQKVREEAAPVLTSHQHRNPSAGQDSTTNVPVNSPEPETVAGQKLREEPTPAITSHQHPSSSAANLPRSGSQPPGKGLTKAQKRRRKRHALKAELIIPAALEDRPESGGHEVAAPRAEAAASRAASLPPTVVWSPPQVPSNECTSSTSEQTSSSASNRPIPMTVTMSSPPPANGPARNHRQGALAMKAGMKTQGGDQFIPIRNIELGLGFFNVIGVVTSAKPLTSTRTEEWCRIFSIVDPSCMEDDVNIVNYNFTVNCFQKKHAEWLPRAEVGDIVIFRRLKATSPRGGGVNGTGYGDKLRWVTYDIEARRFREPDRKDAPHSETADQGFGYSYSPYYEPSIQGKEAEYCAQLADWWQAIQTNQQGITTVQCVARPSREHHLISEVTPETSPQGYFDCTVEILHSYENSSGPNTVYVTDYTINPHTNPTQASWCSPELSPYAFRIEMWDDAGQLAKTMQPGEFWYLQNARVMANSSYPHPFGKLRDAHKSKKLDEVQNGKNLHFRAFLERKKKFEQGEGASGSSARFDNKLIEDVDEEVRFFHCTVEVLRVDLASAEEPLIYVTDYTFNPDLVNPLEPAPWALGLDRRIVKIILEGGQIGRARDLQPGAMYRIKNLRLIRRTGVKGAFGRLGGDERLIIAANDREKEEVKALLQRKEKWKLEMKRDGVSIESAGGSPTDSRPPTAETSENLTVKQVIASTVCPNTFTFVARVADFYPFDLHQATFLLCTKCGTKLRPTWKRCVDCDDMLNTHCKWFHGLHFQLEDDEGSDIIVSAGGKKCKLLSGLPPADLEGDEEAFDRFIARLQPVIGNLRQVHDTWAKKKYLPVDTPKMRFTVESWNAKDKRGYGLLECTPL